MRFLPAAALTTTLALGLAVAPAQAADYCVTDAQPSCVSTHTTIQAALNAAGGTADADRVLIGAHEYAVPTNGFSYGFPSAVEVRGAGPDATVLRQPQPTPAGFEPILLVGTPSAARSLITQLGFVVADNTTGAGGANHAIGLSDGVDVSDVKIRAAGTDRPRGITATGQSTVTRADIDVGFGTGISDGIFVPVGGAIVNVNDSALRADVPVTSVGGATVNLNRSTLEADLTALQAIQGTISADNTVIRVTTASDPALSAGAASGNAASIVLRNVTLTGGGPTTRALQVSNDSTVGSDAVGIVKDSILRTRGSALNTVDIGGAGGGTSAIGAGNTAYDPTATQVSGGSIVNGSPTTAAPGFLGDPALGQVQLRHDSALIDAGAPGSGAPIEDRDGNARPVDGNGDGTAVRDIGAYEYQRRPPVVTAAADPAAALVGTPFSWTATASDPDGDPLTVAWSFDDGGTGTNAVESHAFATPGTHSGTATATDATGLLATSTAAVDVTAPTGSPGGGGGVAPDTLGPRFSIARRGLRLSRRRVVAIRVTCDRAETENCSGRLTLASRRRIAPRRRILTIGRASFNIAPGRTRTLNVRVSRRSARILQRRRRVPVLATATARDAAGNQTTVRRNATLVSTRTGR